MRLPHFVDFMSARADGAERRPRWLPERFDDLGNAAAYAIDHFEERGWMLTERSFNIVDEAGHVVLTADNQAT